MRETKKRIWLFLGMGFGITWVGLIIAYLCGVRYGNFLSNTLLTTMLFLPSLVVLLSHLITGEEFDPAGLGILPHIKGNIPRYLLAYFFPSRLYGCVCSVVLCLSSSESGSDGRNHDESVDRERTGRGVCQRISLYASAFERTCRSSAGDRHRLYGRIGFPWISSFQTENIVWPGKKSSRNRKLTLVGVVFAAVFLADITMAQIMPVSLFTVCCWVFLPSISVFLCFSLIFAGKQEVFSLALWPEAALMLWLRFRCILQRAAPAC